MWCYVLHCDGCDDKVSDDRYSDRESVIYIAGLRGWKQEENNGPYSDDDWWYCPRCQLARAAQGVPKLPLTVEAK